MNSGGASAAKEPGHFEVRTASTQVTSEKLVAIFSRRLQSTKAANATDCFAVKIKKRKQIKQSDMVKFLFFVHTITKAIGRAETGRWIFQPDHDLARCGLVPPLCINLVSSFIL